MFSLFFLLIPSVFTYTTDVILWPPIEAFEYYQMDTMSIYRGSIPKANYTSERSIPPIRSLKYPNRSNINLVAIPNPLFPSPYINHLNTQTRIRNKNRPKIVKRGKRCVYDAECSACPGQFSCVANNCQCFPNTFGRTRSDIVQSDLFCVEHMSGNTLFTYYLASENRCHTDEPIPDVFIESCRDHDVYQSYIDDKTYCLNALTPLNYVCSDNMDCNEIVEDTNTIFALCWNNICHVRSVRNITEYLLLYRDDCSELYPNFCVEHYEPPKRLKYGRIVSCMRKCQTLYKTGGEVNIFGDCSCYQHYPKYPNRISRRIYTVFSTIQNLS